MGRHLAYLLILLIPCSAFAADDFATKLKELTRKAREVEGTYRSEERKLRSIDEEVSKIQGRIPTVRQSVQKKQEQIREYDRQMEIYRAELEKSRERITREWVILYKFAALDKASVYYGHEKYAGYLNAVFRHHEEALKRYQALQAQVQSTRAKVNAVSELLKKDLDELQSSASALSAQRARKAALVTSLKGKSREYQDEIEDLIKLIQKREKERKEREKKERAKREKERKEREKKAKARGAPKVREKPKDQPIVASGGFFESKGRLPWPVRGRVVRPFGQFSVGGVLQKSQGIDIEVPQGASVKCIYAGTVVYADWMGKYGNTVILDHGDGFYSIYGYLQEVMKSSGQKVAAHEVIGTVGESGSALKPALHFEIRFHQKALDPATWLVR
ncbi:MAG TPA: peptidoglycan DD-metalloendopeptidase family protein [Deltaproteobacteria bacterium]|jgi:septal ring factor EnvC (AmiA/AmiB activator)|nr:peptidoglycan DD-metalloendopeptidase family protein [Deltaproteobacteria bacterium]HOI07936.1 peptidoglycan DD-metalloendopeptidase family protein [Deltaproteobacteria bacterium]